MTVLMPDGLHGIRYLIFITNRIPIHFLKVLVRNILTSRINFRPSVTDIDYT